MAAAAKVATCRDSGVQEARSYQSRSGFSLTPDQELRTSRPARRALGQDLRWSMGDIARQLGIPRTQLFASVDGLQSSRFVTYMGQMASSSEPVDFEAWYRREHPRLVTLLTAVTGDPELGCEAVDEALARTFERWGVPDGRTGGVDLSGRTQCGQAPGPTPNPGAPTPLARRPPPPVPGPTGELWLLVAELAPRQRTAVLLRHIGQFTEQEIAEVMGIARGTVSAMLRAAYRRLGAAINDPREDQREVSNG
jgi:DNA-directed RNA polymerase specialized sigma24 family protein